MSKGIAAVLSWLVLVVCPLPVLAAPTIAAGSATVGVGDTFTIQVSISDAQDLSAWQVDLAFDPSIIQANSIAEGPFMSGFGQTLFTAGVIDNGSGLITLTADSFVDLEPYPSGDGVLAEIEFTALAVGTSDLTLSNLFLDFVTPPEEVAVQAGTVTVLARVPEPGTLALVGLATGVMALRRRQDRMGGNEAARRPIG
jgi:general secretion pathway protein D